MMISFRLYAWRTACLNPSFLPRRCLRPPPSSFLPPSTLTRLWSTRPSFRSYVDAVAGRPPGAALTPALVALVGGSVLGRGGVAVGSRPSVSLVSYVSCVSSSPPVAPYWELITTTTRAGCMQGYHERGQRPRCVSLSNRAGKDFHPSSSSTRRKTMDLIFLIFSRRDRARSLPVTQPSSACMVGRSVSRPAGRGVAGPRPSLAAAPQHGLPSVGRLHTLVVDGDAAVRRQSVRTRWQARSGRWWQVSLALLAT